MAVQQSTLIITVNAQQARRDIERLDRSLVDLERSGTRSTTALGRSVSSLTGYMAGLLSVGTAISKMDAYTNLQNRLKLVTESQQELNKATKDTFEIAQKTAQAWDSVVQVYQRFSDNAKTLGLDMQRVAGLTETVAKSISISGASAASAEAALVQFGQALASGVLRGEEFNSIAEQAPALLKAIANGLGVNIGQLRSMAAEGKLTGDVVVEALEKSKKSVDELFAKTDFTVANSFTQLNNALTQFVGEAGKANGAASFLSTTIKSLADNLGAIANVAVLGGVALLTKAIATQAIAVKEAIGASVARRAALTAELQAQVQLAAVEVARTRQAAALALTELGLARAEYNSALSAEARAAAIMRLTQAEIAHNLAINRNTAALAAQTAAQNALTASQSVGARVFAALGGGVGVLTIAVTALAAGYMYMKHRAEEANKKLEEQMEIASKTREELLALKGVQKDVAVNELKDAFEKQNVSLRKLNNEYLGFIGNIANSGKKSKDVNEIFELARKGAITNAEALERLNKLNILTPEQKKQGLDLVNSYILQAQETLKAEKALNVFGVTVKLTGNAAENAAQKVALNTNAAKENEDAVKKATKAQQEYAKSLSDRTFYAGFKTRLIEKHGFSKEQAEELAKAQEAAGGRGKKISAESAKAALATVDAEKKLGDTIKAKENAIKDGAKVEKDAAKQREKYAKDDIKFSEEQAEVMYRYGSDETKRSADLQKEIANLKKYGLTQYVAIAKTRYEEEKKLAKMNFEYDLVEFRLSEEKKIRYRANIREQEIIADTSLTKEQTEQKLAALKIETAQQLYDARLAQKQRIFNAEEFQYTEMERIKKRYELEREEIGKTHDVVERNALLQVSIAKQRIEEFETLAKYADVIQSTRQSVADGLFQKKSPDQYAKFQLQNEYSDASGQLQGAYNDQVNGISLIEDEQTRNAQLLGVHEQYLQARQALGEQYAEKERDMQRAQLDLQLANAGSFFGSMTEMLKNSGAERTGIYKVMFATEKALAIARSIMAIQTGIAEASANPFPYNLAAMASVAAATAGIVGNIQSVAGVFHGGKDYVPKEATYLLDKGERVLSPRQNTDLTQFLNSRRENNNPVNVTINVPQGYTATEKTDANGNVTIDVVDKRIRQAFGRINDANSYESKQLQRNTTARRERM